MLYRLVIVFGKKSGCPVISVPGQYCVCCVIIELHCLAINFNEQAICQGTILLIELHFKRQFIICNICYLMTALDK